MNLYYLKVPSSAVGNTDHPSNRATTALAEMLYADLDQTLNGIIDLPDPDLWHEICNKASFLFCNYQIHNNLSFGEMSLLYTRLTDIDTAIGKHIDHHEQGDGYFRFSTFLLPGISVYWLGQYVFPDLAPFIVDPYSASVIWKLDIIGHLEAAIEILEEGIEEKDTTLQLDIKLINLVINDTKNYEG